MERFRWTRPLQIQEPRLLVGVSAGIHTMHAIIVRQELDGRLRLMGEHRDRQIVQLSNEALLVQRICESIERAVEDAQVSSAEIQATGIAVAGQVDLSSGLVLFAPLFAIRDRPFPLAEKLSEHLNVGPVALISNDDARGIGEQKIGAGKGTRDIVYVRVGYSVGASIIINDELYTGADNLAGDFGHMVIDPQGTVCDCGHRGCLETIVSRAAIGRKLIERYRNGERTVMQDELNKELPDINSALIEDAIDQEDVLACQVVEEAAEMLGVGLGNIINFLNPRTVILGGDVVDEISLFFEKAVASAERWALPTSMKNVSIVRGRLGTTAGAYGAAVFARDRFQQPMGA